MIIDGKALARTIVEDLQLRAVGSSLSLGVLMGEGDAASASFVRIKERVATELGVSVVPVFIAQDMTTEEAVDALVALAARTDGVIVQLPLPSHIDTETVLAHIPRMKDVDGINPSFADAERAVLAPVAEAVLEICRFAGVSLAGKRAVVVGAGRLVGAPTAAALLEAGARVSVVTETRGSLEELKQAEVVVLGTGTPGLVKKEMLSLNVVLIDAGTSESSGRLAGDADPACAEVASVFTPVPGGVGPVAVAMIFKNLLTLAGF